MAKRTLRPDEIKRYIQASFKNVVARPRSSPYGWAFFYGKVRRGPHSTRIARAVDDGRGGTEFKLSATSRLKGKNVVCSITSEEQLHELFEEELKLGLENYGWSEQS